MSWLVSILRYAFGPASYERLQAAFPGTDVTTLSDTQVSPYADFIVQQRTQIGRRKVPEIENLHRNPARSPPGTTG